MLWNHECIGCGEIITVEYPEENSYGTAIQDMAIMVQREYLKLKRIVGSIQTNIDYERLNKLDLRSILTFTCSGCNTEQSIYTGLLYENYCQWVKLLHKDLDILDQKQQQLVAMGMIKAFM